MGYAQQMLAVHPRGPQRDLELVSSVLEEVSACAVVCRTCSDACVAEEAASLTHCIRVTQDCADVCAATSGLLARMTEPDGQLLRSQLEACRTACQVCAEECERHASMHEHCRICAEHCRACEQACGSLLASFRRAAA